MQYREKYEVTLIDCVWDRCKNIHKINTIEIFFTITSDDFFSIEYQFHKIDFEIWLTILSCHREKVSDSILYDYKKTIVNEPIQSSEYNFFILKSKQFDLYRNINLIPCLIKDNWNNINESMMLNTISGSPLIK